jgi:hypothetical protein
MRKSRKHSFSARAWAFVPVLSLAACAGDIREGGDRPPTAGGRTDGQTGTNPSGVPTATGPQGAPGATPAAGGMCKRGAAAAALRRLTRREYDNTVRDLLGDSSHPAATFGNDGAIGVFDNNTSSPVSPVLATDYQTAAEALAARAAANLGALLPCKTTDEACARQFIAAFGKKAFRRPLGAAEVDRYVKLYAAARAHGSDFTGAVRVLIAGFLQSPLFLDHIERGGAATAPGSATTALSPYEIASRLSYFLWQSMPDDALFAAADSGRLSDPQEIAAQARRLLSDPRARTASMSFYGQWLDLDLGADLEKNTKLFPAFSPALRANMRSETESFVDSVVWDGDARLATLLTGAFSYLNAPLARIYRVPGVTGDDLRRVDLNTAERGGILTQPSFLASHATSEQTAPVRRGKFVRERLFCQQMPPPPPDVVPVLPPPDPKLTTRQRYAAHLGDPLCGGCHSLMNPIGLSMEKYDALGQYRTVENGLPIDASGEVLGTGDANGAFDGLLELGARLARSNDVHACIARQLFTYAVGRREAAEDGCALQELGATFSPAQGNLRDLLVSIVRTEAFRTRTVIAQEVCP